jgi:hypothetical protein
LRQAASEYLTPVFMDVTDEASIAAAANTVAQAVGEAGLAGLVNNAGVGVPGPIEYIAADDLRRQSEAIIRQFPPEGHQHYEQTFRNFVDTTVAREKKGSPPEVVARTVLKALDAKTPKMRYPVGTDARTLTVLPRILPTRWLDKIRFKLLGLPQQFGIWADSDQSKTANVVPLQHEMSR